VRRDAARKLALRVTDAAKAVIAEEGYDPVYGARPLKRAIQRLVQNPLALHVLEGEFDDGDTVVVDRDPTGTGLVFRSGGAGVEDADTDVPEAVAAG
jgi:ATP-dependent Clp protease ATP-binding subunit ClpB